MEKCCEHVIKIEDYYQKTERIMQAIEPVILNLDSDVESSDGQESESEIEQYQSDGQESESESEQ